MSQEGMARLEEIVRAVVTGPEGVPGSTMTVLAAELRTHPNLLLEALRWKKLLKRVPSSSTSSGVRPTSALGGWYVDILFTEPARVVIYVSDPRRYETPRRRSTNEQVSAGRRLLGYRGVPTAYFGGPPMS